MSQLVGSGFEFLVCEVLLVVGNGRFLWCALRLLTDELV